MSVRSEHRDVEHLAGQDVGGSHTSADHGSSGSVKTCVRSLGSAESEFHDPVALRCVDDTGRFRRDQTLMVDNVQDRGLNKLRLHDRSDHFHKRFLREDHAALRDRVDISTEVKAAQILEEVFAEDTKAAQIVYIII